MFVWFALHRDSAEYEECAAALGRSERWKGEVEGGPARWVERAPEVLRLAPSRRSRLRGEWQPTESPIPQPGAMPQVMIRRAFGTQGGVPESRRVEFRNGEPGAGGC